MKIKRTTLGWQQIQKKLQASRRLDDVQKAVAARAMSKLMHAYSVGDLRALHSAIELLGRVFLKFDENLDD